MGLRWLIPYFTCLSLWLSVSACSDMKSRPETADKLKPILIQVNAPTAAAPTYKAPLWGESVRLDFHFIAPRDFPAITATAEIASPVPLTVPSPLPTIIGSPEVNNSLPGMQHIVVRTTVQLPTLAQMKLVYPEVETLDFVRFRYALSVVSSDARVVPLTGDFPAYRAADAPGADWNLYSSAITAPSEGSEVPNKLDIKSEIVNPQEEPIKIAWFVSEGEIKNRRAAETEWELPGAGAYTLVFTVRGKQSRSGAIGFRTVTVP